MNIRATIAAAAAVIAAANADAAKKYIFSSWELGDTTPQEILAHADEFDKTGCDGLSFGMLRTLLPGADGQHHRHLMEEPRWTDEELNAFAPVFSELAKHPSMQHSFFGVNTAPRKARLAWTDDESWARYTDSISAVARLAKKVGFAGLITDFEDYWKKKQFKWQTGDPEWAAAKALARKRGAQVFGGVFKAYPEATILSFQLLTTDTEYAKTDDPVALMEEKRDLWPSFVNGMLDALPPTAKLVDGNESFGYLARASKNAFYRSVRDQLSGVLPLVARENRAKYRAQLSVSFGLYVDSYACPTNSPWCLEAVRGKRITHFEDNLRQATECADEYVWFWGEKGFWIDWPETLKDNNPDWRDIGKRTWREKYFNGEWGRIRPWNDTLDGNFDLLLRGVKTPMRCVREEYARQKADGSFQDIFTGMKLNVATNGNASVFVRKPKFETDGWYGLRVKGRGEVVRGNVYFQYNGSWRWNLGACRFSFAPPDAGGWRDGAALLRIPDGANNIYVLLDAGKDEKVRKVEFRDLEIFRIK